MTSPVNPLSRIINIGPGQTYAATPTIPAKYQTAITEIKNRQTETGSIISEHINVKKNGYTTIKMLEIPGYQLSGVIEQWGQLGHKINEYTIKDKAFINYLIYNTDIRSYSYTAKMPKLYFLVKNEIAEPIIYGGKIIKFLKQYHSTDGSELQVLWIHKAITEKVMNI
jgi:hypothetical protein